MSSSFVVVAEDEGGWVVVAKVYDASTKRYSTVKSKPIADRNAAVANGREMALENNWQFIS